MGEWVALGFTILIQAVTAAYVYGKLTERVAGQGHRITSLEKRVDDHGERITRLESQ